MVPIDPITPPEKKFHGRRAHMSDRAYTSRPLGRPGPWDLLAWKKTLKTMV
jgi:hypothetical protein